MSDTWFLSIEPSLLSWVSPNLVDMADMSSLSFSTFSESSVKRKIFVKDVQTSLCLWSKLSQFTHFVSMIDFKVGSCKCGVKKSRRIIGGSETEVLQLQNKTICRLWQTIWAKWRMFTKLHPGEWISLDDCLCERNSGWRVWCYIGK